MNRCEQKHKIIKIIEETNNWDMLDKIENMFKEEPKYITDFITELFEKNYGHIGVNGEIGDKVYCINEVMYAFEYDIRRIWIEVESKLIPDSEYIDHWSELCVKTNRYKEELDLWISEQGYLFDSRELAWVVFNIWCGKVTFNK